MFPQLATTAREGKGARTSGRGRKTGRRHLAGAEETGDDGGGHAGVQRLRVEGRVGVVPRKRGQRRRERAAASGEGIERITEKRGGGGDGRGSGRPQKQQPCSCGHHVNGPGAGALAWSSRRPWVFGGFQFTANSTRRCAPCLR